MNIVPTNDKWYDVYACQHGGGGISHFRIYCEYATYEKINKFVSKVEWYILYQVNALCHTHQLLINIHDLPGYSKSISDFLTIISPPRPHAAIFH